MKYPLVKDIASVHASLPRTLLHPMYAEKIQQFATGLPKVSLISYECRLSAGNDRVDLALCAHGKKDGQTLKSLTIPDAADRNGWKQVQRLASHWVDGIGMEFVSSIWLNFDVNPAAALPEPWVYVIFAETKIIPELKLAMISRLLESFGPQNAQMRPLAHLLTQLPAQAHWVGLGMPSGRESALRMVIYRLSLEEITKFLSQAGWSGNVDDFQKTMLEFSSFASSLGLIFDVDVHGLAPLVGIEFYLNKEDLVAPLIEALVKHDFASPEKADAVMDWVPASGKHGDRWVSHVKVTYEAGQEGEAKIYLYHQLDKDLA